MPQISYAPHIFSAPSSLALSHLQRPQLVGRCRITYTPHIFSAPHLYRPKLAGRCRIIGSWQLVYAPYVHPDDAYDVR